MTTTRKHTLRLDVDIFKLVDRAVDDGVIVYEVDDARDLFACVEKMSGKFCGFCTVFSIMSVRWFSNCYGHQFLYVDIDTESGGPH
jgi:hypothetical protein